MPSRVVGEASSGFYSSSSSITRAQGFTLLTQSGHLYRRAVGVGARAELHVPGPSHVLPMPHNGHGLRYPRTSSRARSDLLSDRPPVEPCPSGRPAHHPHLGHGAGSPIHRCHPHHQHGSGRELLDRGPLQVRSVEGQGLCPEGGQQLGSGELDLAHWLQHYPWAVANRGDVRKGCRSW